jgi:hypothetical protein
VNLATNFDKSHLRIRLHNRDGDDNENDGSKSNLPADIKLKVRHITRVGSDSEKSDGGRDGSSEQLPADKSTSYFVIKTKTSVGDASKFKFVAESLAERDTVVLAIRCLMDQARTSQNNGTRKTHSVDRLARGEQKVLGDNGAPNEASGQQPKDENEVVFYASDTGNGTPSRRNDVTGPFHDGKDDSESRSFHVRKVNQNGSDGSERRVLVESNGIDVAPASSEFDGPGMATDTTCVSVQKQCSATSITPVEKDATNEAKIKSTTQLEIAENIEKHLTVDSHRQESSVTHVSSKRTNHTTRRTRSIRKKDTGVKEGGVDGNNTMDGIKASLVYEAIGCNAMGCHSKALAAVEDGDLATMAANQMAGPWCTDDICTASLKDFAESMKGIFHLKEGSGDGVDDASAKQRAMAEEYLSGFLGDKTTMGEFLSVKDLWSIAAMKHATGTKLKMRRLQNRARRSADGKAIRLKGLKTQMTFSGADTKTKSFLQTTHSFDDVSRTGKWDRQKDSSVLMIGGQFDSSAYLDKNMNALQESDGCEILFYDSDPEDAREMTLKRGPRRVIAERESGIHEEIKTRPREALDIFDSSRLGLGRKWKRLDEELVQDIIEVCAGTLLTRLESR